MRVLALDSSGLVASVAVVEDEEVLAEYSVNYARRSAQEPSGAALPAGIKNLAKFKKTHSQTLLPMLDEIMKMAELDLKDIDAIAVAGGPGSFTGLRIGSATAKGLGLALDKPLVCVPTLEGLAYNLYGSDGLICPIMDARRAQVYTGIYTFIRKESGERMLQTVLAQTAVSVEELIRRLNALGQTVVFAGDGVSVYRQMLEEGLTTEHFYAPAHVNRQRAAAIGALGVQYAKAGKYETAAEHKPEYLRKTQAEREREKR